MKSVQTQLTELKAVEAVTDTKEAILIPLQIPKRDWCLMIGELYTMSGLLMAVQEDCERIAARMTRKMDERMTCDEMLNLEGPWRILKDQARRLENIYNNLEEMKRSDGIN